jgi:membrane protein DedA with SNARE-associated domain
MTGIESHVLELVRQIYDAIGWIGVVGLMAVESALIPMPSEIIMPLAGWMLVQEEGRGLPLLLFAGLCGAVGNLIGSLLAYWLGAAGGRPLLQRYGKYVLVDMRDLERADRWFSEHGEATAFFSRLLPVVRTFISFPAGVSRMNLTRFSVYTFIGAYLWSLALAYGGYVLGQNWERVREVMRPFDIPIGLVILGLMGWYVYRHVRRRSPADTGD